jgi:hypothetical protein
MRCITTKTADKINGSSIKDEQHQAKATGDGHLFFCRLILFFTSPEQNSTQASATKVICSVNDLLTFPPVFIMGAKVCLLSFMLIITRVRQAKDDALIILRRTG